MNIYKLNSITTLKSNKIHDNTIYKVDDYKRCFQLLVARRVYNT